MSERLLVGNGFSTFSSPLHQGEAPDLGHGRAGAFSHHHLHVLPWHPRRHRGVRRHLGRVLRQRKEMASRDRSGGNNARPEGLKFMKPDCAFVQNCDVVNRVLVGNKDDDPSRKVVLTEDARAFAAQMGIQVRSGAGASVGPQSTGSVSSSSRPRPRRTSMWSPCSSA